MGNIKSCVEEIIRERRENQTEPASGSQLRYVASLLERAGFSDWDEVLEAFADHPHSDVTLPLHLEDLTKGQAGFLISRGKDEDLPDVRPVDEGSDEAHGVPDGGGSSGPRSEGSSGS